VPDPAEPGKKFGRYEVRQVLGRGSMGAVCLATDPAIDRPVAIKLVQTAVQLTAPELEKYRERFQREAKAAGRLSHPGIVTVFDVGHTGEQTPFIVMEYVKGRTLQEILRPGPLPIAETLRLADGILDALGYAHRQGIVHRDIKPENVLLQEGHALVADFGIARAASLAGEVELTQTGMVVGTPSYMSPEQTVGDNTIDGRSDIYSLACLLFELLSGAPPFTGGGAAAVARRRLTEAAPRLRATASDVPAAIDEAVAKALAREPGERFATAEEFAAALRGEAAAAGTASAGAAAKGLVVLPFGNLSPDPENEFFADGLTEEVIADLSGIRALRVISRTSAMRFKGTDKDLKAIARELNVRYVLEGSVRRAGSSLRVTAQLIEADTDSHVWAEKYSGSIDDVFAIQEEISRKIVKALQVKLTDTESRAVAERPIDNATAYDCYLRAHHEMFKFTPESLERAERLADAGLQLIGENPMLLATRGLVSWYYVNFSIRPEERYLDEAASFAARALDRDPDAFLGIYLRGLIAAKRGDLEGAVRDMRRANERKPGDAEISTEWVRHLFSAGRELTDRARSVLEEAHRVDPLNPLNWVQKAWFHHVAGRPVEAEQAARRSIELSDPGVPPRAYGAYTLALIGRRDEAIGLFGEVAAALGHSPYGSLSAFYARALQGDAAGARHVTPLLEQSARWVEYMALFLAECYALIGRRDDALRWLQRAMQQGFINHPFLARDPFLESLRGDAEYEALMQQVQRRWQAFDA
jgi:serine/threonine protein kinase